MKSPLFTIFFVLMISGVTTVTAYTFPSRAVEAIYKLTSIFENSSTTLDYTFCEDINDGRGYTFGFPGFCSGTYDGTMFLKEYRRINPSNRLVKYIPAFEAIDDMDHPDGMQSSHAGLAGFQADFAACESDPLFATAQHNLVDELYFNPSQVAADEIGAQFAITRGELYDAFINHGEGSPGNGGARDIMAQATQAVGGTPATGVSERVWLAKFLELRHAILSTTSGWIGSEDRVEAYQKLLAEDNVGLIAPFDVSCYGEDFTVTTATSSVIPAPIRQRTHSVAITGLTHTTLSAVFPSAGRGTLSILSTNGRLICRNIFAVEGYGAHTIPFSPRAGVSSGTYILSIDFSGTRSTMQAVIP